MTEESQVWGRRADRRRRTAVVAGPASRHSGGWLITYSDMVTLLMAFFIGVIALCARGPGSGKQPAEQATADTTVWRPRAASATVGESGSPPQLLYHNPTPQTTATLLRCLETSPREAVESSRAVRLPLNLLFDAQMRLTPWGSRQLGAIAAAVRALPCDLHFHVEKSRYIPQAVDLCSYLMLREGLVPGRLAVGCHPPVEGTGEGIWLVLVRQL